MLTKLAETERETACLGPSRGRPSFGLQASPDLHEFRTDLDDPKAKVGKGNKTPPGRAAFAGRGRMDRQW